MIDRPTTAPRRTVPHWTPAPVPGSGVGPPGGRSPLVGCVSCTRTILPRPALRIGIAPGQLVRRGSERVASEGRHPRPVAEQDRRGEHEVDDPDAEALPVPEI